MAATILDEDLDFRTVLKNFPAPHGIKNRGERGGGTLLLVRSISPDEWRTWKNLRLEALADSPDAFGETLEQALGRSDAEWAEFAAGSSLPDRAFFVAENAGNPVGMAIIRGSEGDSARAHIFAMWVAPTARGIGAGRKLLDAAMAWGRHHGFDELVLQVTEGNDRAKRLYETAGFVDTGRREPLRPGTAMMTAVMVFDVAARGND